MDLDTCRRRRKPDRGHAISALSSDRFVGPHNLEGSRSSAAAPQDGSPQQLGAWLACCDARAQPRALDRPPRLRTHPARQLINRGHHPQSRCSLRRCRSRLVNHLVFADTALRLNRSTGWQSHLHHRLCNEPAIRLPHWLHLTFPPHRRPAQRIRPTLTRHRYRGTQPRTPIDVQSQRKTRQRRTFDVTSPMRPTGW